MIFPTILAIAAADLRAANSRVADLPVKDSQTTNSWIETSQGGGSKVEDPRVEASQGKSSQTEDLGVYGETFPIEEKSMLEVIRAKLQALSTSGKLEEHQQIILKKAKEQLNRPPPVKNIHRTTTPRSFGWAPSITVPYDLKDHKSQVFHRQGTRVNPLDTHQMTCPLLFVDGDDSEQVFWAIKHYKAASPSHKPKIILVQGVPLELSKKFNLPVYFDQHGALVKKLGITQVPARVSQAGKVLVVDEVDLKAEQNSAEPKG